MQFALVDDMFEVPLAATEGVSVSFEQVSGTPTCELDDYDADNANSGSYFVDDFDDVYIPDDGDNGSASMLTAVLEVTIVSAIAVIGALFFGGII
jgi:hypothetical protein